MKLPHLARSYVRDENLAVKLFWGKVVSTFSYYGSKKIIFNLLICSTMTSVNTHSLNSFYFLSPRKVIRARVISIFFETVWHRTFFMGFFLFLDTHWVGRGGVMDFIKWNLSRVIILSLWWFHCAPLLLPWSLSGCIFPCLWVSLSVCHR